MILYLLVFVFGRAHQDRNSTIDWWAYLFWLWLPTPSCHNPLTHAFLCSTFFACAGSLMYRFFLLFFTSYVFVAYHLLLSCTITIVVVCCCNQHQCCISYLGFAFFFFQFMMTFAVFSFTLFSQTKR